MRQTAAAGKRPAIQLRFISAEQLAIYISKSVDAIYQMVHRRQIPVTKMGRTLRFDLREIDTWLERQSRDYREVA